MIAKGSTSTSAHCIEWYQSLWLQERLSTLRSRERPRDPSARARWRLGRWRWSGQWAKTEFCNSLRELGLDEETLLGLLDESAEELALRCDLPDWLKDFNQSFEPYLNGAEWPSLELPRWARVDDLFRVAAPLIECGLRQIRRGLQQISSLNRTSLDLQSLEQLFIPEIASVVFKMVYRSLILELNIGRESGTLVGRTPLQRYQHFINLIQRPQWAFEFFLTYPVLARDVVDACRQWKNHCLLFTSRLITDWALITKLFLRDQSPKRIVYLRSSAGDRHQDGQSVILICFSNLSSNRLKLVYKPRSLAVEQHFAELLSWFNGVLKDISLRVPRVLDRGDYGWSEYIEQAPCEDEKQLERFYFRQGIHLFLMYLLDGTDVHHENLIAAGEHPVIVDLETLFAPLLTVEANLNSHEVRSSVMGSLLLPSRRVYNFGQLGFDESALGAGVEQMTNSEVVTISNFGTDEMSVIKKSVPAAVHKNRPSLSGSPVQPSSYVESIVDGFCGAYRVALREATTLKAEHGPIKAFSHDTVRVVLRATHEYVSVLSDSLHPDLLQDALDREMLFERLEVARRHFPILKAAREGERRDLFRRDIPYFTTSPSSCYISASTGERLKTALAYTPLDRVLYRLDNLTQEDLTRQVRHIRGTMACISQHAPLRTREPARSEVHPVNTNSLIQAAHRLGSYIASQCEEMKGGLSWSGLTLIGPELFGYRSVGYDLYSGLSGLALLFGFLGHLTQDDSLSKMAITALQTARRLFGSRGSTLGAFTGVAGYIYAVTELADVINVDTMIQEVPRLLEGCRSSLREDRWCDIISGNAGILAVVLRCYEKVKWDCFLSVADDCARTLVERAQPEVKGLAWKIGSQYRLLGGFSHGASGISWALMRAASVLKNPKYHNVACAGLEFDRTLFDSDQMNWRDLRNDSSGDAAFACAWCHGAPGIGLSRLTLPPEYHDSLTKEEISAALQTTLRLGFGNNHSLCHGDLGNFEILQIASRVLNDSKLEIEAQHRLNLAFDRAAKSGWLCGTPDCVETPGLMAGLAGIAYGLLRATAPSLVPCVLALSGPI